jgi:replicative DNA helicase
MQEKTAHDDPRVTAMTVPAIDRVLDYSRPAMGLSYGHGPLNEFTMGMQPGQVTVVGARSGVGKSALMVQSAYCNARKEIPVSLFSLEMGRDEVLMRLWAMDSGIPFFKIQRKLCNDSERRAVREASYRVAEMPIRIYDDGELALGQIAAIARLDARRHGMQMFAVDYAQIVATDGKEDDRLRVARVSRTLTKLVKAEKVHLMLLSQLRKMPVEQYGRPPHIGDLAETRQLENDCHVCILLHRGWDEEASSISDSGEILIPKQRNGGTGVLPTTFNPKELRYM